MYILHTYIAMLVALYKNPTYTQHITAPHNMQLHCAISFRLPTDECAMHTNHVLHPIEVTCNKTYNSTIN